MIPRGTEAYRAAHRGNISASDAPAIMARDGSKKREALIERLVLDHEDIPDHHYETPNPWEPIHDEAIVHALASYKALIDAQAVAGGLVGSSRISWLQASPHALAGGWAILFRPHASLRAFHVNRGTLSRAWKARAQLTMFVTETSRCAIADFWDGLGRVPDKLVTQWVAFDYPWFTTRVMPRIETLWAEVNRRLQREPIPFCQSR